MKLSKNLIKEFIESGDNRLVKIGLELIKKNDFNYNFSSFETIYNWLQSNLILEKGHTSVEQKIRFINSLKELNLSELKLKKLPESFYLLKNIQYLDLSYNEFDEIPCSLLEFIKLKTLKLSHNSINCDHFYCQYYSNLQTIDLSNNKILNTDFLIYFPNVKNLILSGNENLSFTKYITLNEKLITLEVRSCGIINIPLFISHLKKLSFLDLSDNLLVDLPKELLLKKGLQRLSLNYNSFKKETLKKYDELVNYSYELNYSL